MKRIVEKSVFDNEIKPFKEMQDVLEKEAIRVSPDLTHSCEIKYIGDMNHKISKEDAEKTFDIFKQNVKREEKGEECLPNPPITAIQIDYSDYRYTETITVYSYIVAKKTIEKFEYIPENVTYELTMLPVRDMTGYFAKIGYEILQKEYERTNPGKREQHIQDAITGYMKIQSNQATKITETLKNYQK